MLRNVLGIITFLVLAFTADCGSLGGAGSGNEVVFAATDVGIPNGASVNRSIGQAGGSLGSSDGKVTVTIPPNAMTQPVAFSIQPVTNKAGGGIGNSFRLEPSGTTFAIPVQISIHYDEKDLEGTIPEALSLAYQDQDGAWHAQKNAKLDLAAKTLTVSTTHFSDWAYLARVKLSPSNATLHVGESQVISVVVCEDPGFVDRFMNRPAKCSTINKWDDSHWNLKGEGTLTPAGLNRIYTAPGKKPTPNLATVVFSFEMTSWDNDTAHAFPIKGSYEAKITITAPGYKVEPGDGPAKYSGIVCSLEAPFTISVTEGQVADIPITFRPSSANSGSAAYRDSKGAVMLGGSGPYTIEGSDTKRPEIAWKLAMNMRAGPAGYSSDGVTHIYLSELETDECK